MAKREYDIKNSRERILMLPSNMACFIFEKSDVSTLKELASATNPSINVKRLKRSDLLDIILEDYILVYGSDYYTCMLKDYIEELRMKENESVEEKLAKATKRKAFKRLKEQVEVTSEVVNRDIECLVSDLVINCERMIDKVMEEYDKTNN